MSSRSLLGASCILQLASVLFIFQPSAFSSNPCPLNPETRHLSSALCPPTSVLCPLSSALCPLIRQRRASLRHPSPSSIQHPVSSIQYPDPTCLCALCELCERLFFYHLPYFPISHSRTALCIWSLFSDWSHTTDRSPSRTSSLISSPRWAGRQCITITSSAPASTSARFT